MFHFSGHSTLLQATQIDWVPYERSYMVPLNQLLHYGALVIIVTLLLLRLPICEL